MSFVVKVCIPNTQHDGFDYDTTLNLQPGMRVWVPFRQSRRVGVVVAVERFSEKKIARKLKSVEAAIDDGAILLPPLLALCEWISHYYQAALSEVIPYALPQYLRRGDPYELAYTPFYSLRTSLEEAHAQISPQAHRQHALIDFIHQQAVVDYAAVLHAGFKKSQWDSLLAAQLLQVEQRLLQPPMGDADIVSSPISLNEEQHAAVTYMAQQGSGYHCAFLYGVTGSGKTEVYLQVILQALQADRQVLVLVPEIGLTPQLLARFRARLTVPMAVIHSHLSERERLQAWQWAKEGLVRVVIGTRAAVFTPLPQLGLIIIDEEHDSSFKQQDNVRYSARDTALIRAHRANIPIMLGSATPSLESLNNVLTQKYTLLRLSHKALSTTALHYQLIDLRQQTLQHGLAPATMDLIHQHVQQQHQVLVFINRRGFSPVLLCHQCGWMPDCPGCDAHLTWHRQQNQLMCHHCGLYIPTPTQCQSCCGTSFIPVGAGTQRVFEYLQQQLPGTALLRVDRDEVRHKHAMDEALSQIATQQAQVIVGTQMLAKGHHFPRLTLVVVVDTDQGFYNQDFRALEHLGQLLTQVAGRAGRAQWPGQVAIQTHLPQHPLLNLLIQKGYDAFMHALLQQRQQAELPPYAFLAVIGAQSRSLQKASHLLQQIKAHLQQHEALKILGPAPAPLARKAQQHRLQLWVKSSSRKALNESLTQVRQVFSRHPLTRGVVWGVDVDPLSF